jgi:probable selenium-dependent hydroxylase accessory protein YqeC
MKNSHDDSVDLYDLLLPFLPVPADGTGLVVAIVGGGGKTATMFSLASAARDRGLGVAVTTTTHIRDPRFETGRNYDRLVLLDETDDGQVHHTPSRGISVIASGVLKDEGRLHGLDGGQVAALRLRFDLVLVEADGSKGLPIKAPAAHEPAMPAYADLVIGVVGLDCLGKPMDEATVHRPGLFGPLCSCAPGEPINARHIVALCQARDGLFKHCPPQAARVLLLNKADRLLPDAGSRAGEGKGNSLGNGALAGSGSASGSDAESRLTRLYDDVAVLGGHLDAWLVCSLEPRFRLLNAATTGRDGRVREGREG